MVEPVKMLGAEPGMLPTRGLKSTLHIFAGDFKEAISEQNSALFGLAVSHTLPSPLEPTVI